MYTTLYDILCYFLCFLVPARAGSNAAPLRLKSCSDRVQMRPGSNPMLPLLVPYVCLSALASKSGCSGLLIHASRRGHRFRGNFRPPFPPSAGAARERHCPEGAVLPQPPPPPSPRLIWLWREPGGCWSPAARPLWPGPVARVSPATCGYAVRCMYNIGEVQGCHT